jgi:hypothetical protein
LGAASASTDVSSHYGAGGYQTLTIARSEDADSDNGGNGSRSAAAGWTVDVEIRQLASDYAGCRAINRFRFVLPPAD